MFEFELQEFMLKDLFIRQCYGGVIALDEIPKVKVRNKTVYIVNTDPSYKKGQHWILIWYNEKPEYFDPLAQFPPPQIQESLFLTGLAFYRSTRQVQPPFSVKCGEYGLFYAYYRARGYSMEEILQKFYQSLLKFNNLKMSAFYNNYKQLSFTSKNLTI